MIFLLIHVEFDTVIQLLIVRLTLFIILLVVTVLTSMVVISNIYTLLMQLPYCIYFLFFPVLIVRLPLLCVRDKIFHIKILDPFGMAV